MQDAFRNFQIICLEWRYEMSTNQLTPVIFIMIVFLFYGQQFLQLEIKKYGYLYFDNDF